MAASKSKTGPAAGSAPQFPAWLNGLVTGVLGEVAVQAKATLVTRAQSALVEPLAERLGRAMAKAEGEKYGPIWKNRGLAALAELARRPGTGK